MDNYNNNEFENESNNNGNAENSGPSVENNRPVGQDMSGGVYSSSPRGLYTSSDNYNQNYNRPQNQYQSSGAGQYNSQSQYNSQIQYNSQNQYSSQGSNGSYGQYNNSANQMPAGNGGKAPKKGNGGKVFGKIMLAVFTGVVFGVCACLAWAGMNKFMPKETAALVAEAENFDRNAYKAEIEREILAKLEKQNNDAGIVKSVTTDSNVTMQVTDVSDVVADVMPSVVSITNTYTYTMNYWGRSISEQEEASGSGIIIGENDTELLVATNNHVIENADELHVHFIDGETVEAKLKGADADNDIAVIAIKLDGLKPSTRDAIEIAKLGDSQLLKVGEPAIAIGNALGYGQSVTTGVISALDRKLEIEEGKMSEGFIQTDAAINPGNSGGALLNVKGEVVGINSNKIGGSSVEGMGYAIPISRALPIIDDLKTKKTKDGTIEDRGYLGISGRAVSSEMVEVYEFPEGVFVYDVFANTGAEAAGLRKGDIITKFEGITIKSMEALQENMAYYGAGETVELTVARFNDNGAYDEIVMQVRLISASEMPAE